MTHSIFAMMTVYRCVCVFVCTCCVINTADEKYYGSVTHSADISWQRSVLARSRKARIKEEIDMTRIHCDLNE